MTRTVAVKDKPLKLSPSGLPPKFHGYIMKGIRRVFTWWPEKKKAKIRSKGACELCGVKDVKLECDHKIPVIPLTGFDDWDSVINRMLCDADNLFYICAPCHKEKTHKVEAPIRAANRREAKKKG